jgi:isopentenyl diphosphate isomerase/L-lactate dehydrogenase-like FMN-dependent dehydrogenase
VTASTPTDLQRLVNVADFEEHAARVLDAGVHGYYAGGAGDERTLRDNVAAFARHRLLPRVLVDVSAADPATTVLGTPVSMPVLVAPTALQRLAHPDGEPGMARAAADAGTIFTLSTLATSRPTEAAIPGAPQWFQLYVLKDRAVSQALLDEAVDAGFRAIVLTVDAPRAGRRERDLRTGFAVRRRRHARRRAAVGGWDRLPHAGRVLRARRHDADLVAPRGARRELARARRRQGRHSAEDARLAAEHGAAGVIVSNHGGRQLDGVPAALDLLPAVAEAVGDRVEVLMDGGVRRGTDVVTALALGARAVLVGRPALWGLACGGEEGARRVLALLQEEVRLALTLLGAPTPGDVGPQHLTAAR